MANATALYGAIDLIVAKAAEGTHIQSTWVTTEGAYDQESYDFCGTAGCLAGWTVMAAGYTQPILETIESPVRFPLDGGRRAHRYVVGLENPDTGEVIGVKDIPLYAQEALGLDSEQAQILFEARNTLADIKHYADQIVAGEL